MITGEAVCFIIVLATAEHEAERDQEAAISSTNHIHSDWTNKVVSSEE